MPAHPTPMIWVNGIFPSPSFNQNNISVGTHAELELMIRSMRSRHTGLAKSLVALWFVLFFACSLSHAHAGASALINSFSVQVADADSLHTSACPAQLDFGSASTESCNALQNSLLNQQLLMLLAALLGLAGAFDLLAGLPLRLGGAPALTATTPGLPTPMRKHLHRYNE